MYCTVFYRKRNEENSINAFVTVFITCWSTNEVLMHQSFYLSFSYQKQFIAEKKLGYLHRKYVRSVALYRAGIMV